MFLTSLLQFWSWVDSLFFSSNPQATMYVEPMVLILVISLNLMSLSTYNNQLCFWSYPFICCEWTTPSINSHETNDVVYTTLHHWWNQGLGQELCPWLGRILVETKIKSLNLCMKYLVALWKEKPRLTSSKSDMISLRKRIHSRPSLLKCSSE